MRQITRVPRAKKIDVPRGSQDTLLAEGVSVGLTFPPVAATPINTHVALNRHGARHTILRIGTGKCTISKIEELIELEGFTEIGRRQKFRQEIVGRESIASRGGFILGPNPTGMGGGSICCRANYYAR